MSFSDGATSGLWDRLGSPQHVLAPMVSQSELAFRMFCRREYDVHLAYTPMFWSEPFASDPHYRAESFQPCAEDRPVFVQFCGNDADVLLRAARFVEHDCDAVDLNLGCPQDMAREHNFGAFLCSDWQRVRHIVQTLAHGLSVPVSCKIRLQRDVAQTVEFARMLQDAGCQVLCVHGRTRKQMRYGRASWPAIAAVKQAVRIPVIANGNIHQLADVEACRAATGADAFMSAEALLENPAMFSGRAVPPCRLAQQYLDYARRYRAPFSFVRQHVGNMLMAHLAPERRPHLPRRAGHWDLWAQLGAAASLEALEAVIAALETRLAAGVPPPAKHAPAVPPTDPDTVVQEWLSGGRVFSAEADE